MTDGRSSSGKQSLTLQEVLKEDIFGVVSRVTFTTRTASLEDALHRDTAPAKAWARPVARWLMRREVRALRHLQGFPDVPQLIEAGRDALLRSWIDGAPMQIARPTDPAWHSAARRLLVHLHRRGVAHGDLAKEPNWLVTSEGRPAMVDFQLAWISPRRSRFFRLVAREDLRHLLKHKRSYCPEHLTPRELAILARPSCAARALRAGPKRLYLGITRGLLGWRDEEGRSGRGESLH